MQVIRIKSWDGTLYTVEELEARFVQVSDELEEVHTLKHKAEELAEQWEAKFDEAKTDHELKLEEATEALEAEREKASCAIEFTALRGQFANTWRNATDEEKDTLERLLGPFWVKEFLTVKSDYTEAEALHIDSRESPKTKNTKKKKRK